MRLCVQAENALGSQREMEIVGRLALPQRHWETERCTQCHFMDGLPDKTGIEATREIK